MKRYRFFFLLLLISGVLFLPLPYDMVQPGSVRSLGHYHMVTIKIDHANGYKILQSFTDSYARVVPALDFDPAEEKEKRIHSQQTAKQVAVNLLQQPIRNEFDLSQIVGPSAGLIMALELLEQAKPQGLTKGGKIAGTGALNEQGEVEEVGGVTFKLIAADRAGVDVFFVPLANMPELEPFLETYPTDIKVIPVQTIQEAIQYLEKRKDHVRDYRHDNDVS